MTSDAKMVGLTIVLFASLLLEDVYALEPAATTTGAPVPTTTTGVVETTTGVVETTTGVVNTTTTVVNTTTTVASTTTEYTPDLPPFDWVAVPKPSMYRNLTSVPQLATGDIVKIPGRKINKDCLTGRVSEVWQYNDEAQWETESFENCIYACLMFGEECYSASFSYDMPLCFLFNANIDTDEECFEEQEEGQKWDSFAL